jgi:hypothetical protein
MKLKIHYEQRSIIKLAEHGNTSSDPVLRVFLGLDAHEHNEVRRMTGSRQDTFSGRGLVKWTVVENILWVVRVYLHWLQPKIITKITI